VCICAKVTENYLVDKLQLKGLLGNNSARATMDAPTSHPNTTTKDSHNPHPQRRHRRRPVVIACCCLFFLFLFALGLTILVYWLILHPQSGNCTLTDASLNVLNLTHTSAPEYSLDADIDLSIGFNNPNSNMGFNIKGIDVDVLYAGEEIGEAALPPFHQPSRSETAVGAIIRITKFVFSETVGGELEREVERGNVTLQVVVNAKVRGDNVFVASLHPYRGVHVTCFASLMVPDRNGTAPGAMISKSCAVRRDSMH
jgi:hypothetical protein